MVTVTNPGSQTGTVGTAKSLQMSASGGTAPYTWTATGLPAGLTINSSSGLISGTPTAAGTYSSTVTAKDAPTRLRIGQLLLDDQHHRWRLQPGSEAG